MEWTSNASISLYVAAFVEGYKYLGLYMVIFYAALIGVPSELAEAAIVDGANGTATVLACKNPVHQTGYYRKLCTGIKWIFAVI